MNQKPEAKYFKWDTVIFRRMKRTRKIVALFPKVPGCFNAKKDGKWSVTLAEFNPCGEDQQSFRWEDGDYKYIRRNSFPASFREYADCLKTLQNGFEKTTLIPRSKASKAMIITRLAAMKGHLS